MMSELEWENGYVHVLFLQQCLRLLTVTKDKARLDLSFRSTEQTLVFELPIRKLRSSQFQ